MVSPAAGLPGLFPHVYEQGLRRLREVFDLVPVEYPTTRVPGADPRDRARDLTPPSPTRDHRGARHHRRGRPDHRHPAPRRDVLRANPKPYFGYSDNTNLLNHLYRLGMVATTAGR